MSIHRTEDRIVKIAKALSDRTRVKILQEIAKRGKIGCGDAVKFAGLSQPTVSHHVKILIDAGLIIPVKTGRHVSISVNKNALEGFAALLPGSDRSR